MKLSGRTGPKTKVGAVFETPTECSGQTQARRNNRTPHPTDMKHDDIRLAGT